MPSDNNPDTNTPRESPTSSLQGWTKLSYPSGNDRYRHNESGITLSLNKFFKLVHKYKSQGYAPIEDIIAISRAAADRGFMQPTTNPAPKSTVTSTPDDDEVDNSDSDEPITPDEYVQPKLDPRKGTRPTPGGSRYGFRHANNTYPFLQQQTPPKPLHRPTQSRTRNEEEDDPMAQIAADNKPRPRDRRSSHTRPTAAALSIGIKRLILLVTSVIIVRILDDERAKMTEQEATMLSIALGNLLEYTKFNEQWGWIISETGDWQTLGYGLFMYLSRVGDVVREKQQSRASNATYNQPFTNPVNQQQQPVPGSYVSGHNGASLRMNVSSTPIVHPPQ